MSLVSIFATLAFLFSGATYVPYTRAILAGKAQPTVSSWISWWILDVTILVGMLAEGEIAWQMVAYVIGIAFVIAASYYKGAVTGWGRLDLICLTMVIIAIGLWVLSGNPNITIVVSLMAITIGTVPMVVNVWREPAREPLLPWFLSMVGGVFGVLAIPIWNLAAALTPVWLLVLQVLIVLLITRKLRPQCATV